MRQKNYIFSFFLVLLFFLVGCGPKGGVYHKVSKGQTLWRICYVYDVDLQDVAELNNIKDTTDIKIGDNVFIPGVKRTVKVTPYKAPVKTNKIKKSKRSKTKSYYKKKTVKKKKRSKNIATYKGKFAWPVKGKVVKKYGMKGNVMNQGIDISASKGTLIKASASGEVAFVATTSRGLGNFVIIKHPSEFYTVYAYNDVNLVKKGDKVSKGKVIARVGRSGNASTYSTHFEVRDGDRSRNPLFFLP